MSVEDDTELRDLLTQTLETNGCLAKIRAQLRASVFLALDEDEGIQKKEPLLNPKLKQQLESSEGRTMFCIVREFLEFFNLDFTISVYEPESYLGNGYKYEGRYKVIEDLGILQIEENSPRPVLLQLMQFAQNQNKKLDINLRQLNDTNLSESEHNSSDNNEATSKSTGEDTDEFEKSETSQSSKLELEIQVKQNKLNETFNVALPTVKLERNGTKRSENNSPVKEIERILSPHSMASTKSSETSDMNELNSSNEGSSKEDLLIDLDKSLKSHKSSDHSSEAVILSPLVVKDAKKFDISMEKLKSKNDKLKCKNNLTSLVDLPPLHMNKSRGLLPSLYMKEFKEKNSPKEVNALPDPLDSYEEDFMTGSEADLSGDLLNAGCSKVNLLEDFSKSEGSERSGLLNANLMNYKISKEDSSGSSKTKLDVSNGKIESGKPSVARERADSVASSVTSEDFEVNSNVDDILNSS